MSRLEQKSVSPLFGGAICVGYSLAVSGLSRRWIHRWVVFIGMMSTHLTRHGDWVQAKRDVEPRYLTRHTYMGSMLPAVFQELFVVCVQRNDMTWAVISGDNSNQHTLAAVQCKERPASSFPFPVYRHYLGPAIPVSPEIWWAHSLALRPCAFSALRKNNRETQIRGQGSC
jgi:hypothetical protein